MILQIAESQAEHPLSLLRWNTKSSHSQPFLLCHVLWPSPEWSLTVLCTGTQPQELRAGKPFSQPAVYIPAHIAQPTVCFCGYKVLLLNSSQCTPVTITKSFCAKLFSAFLFVKLLGFLLAHISFLKFPWMAAPVIHYFHQFGVTFEFAEGTTPTRHLYHQWKYSTLTPVSAPKEHHQ